LKAGFASIIAAWIAISGSLGVAQSSADSELIAKWDRAPRTRVDIPASGTPVLIVEFADWQCVLCRNLERTYAGIVETINREKLGRVRMVRLDFPFDSSCNSTVPTRLHKAACEAAVAFRIAQARNQGDAMEAWLTSNQTTLTASQVEDHISKTYPGVAFQTEYASRLRDIQQDIDVAAKLTLKSIPVFYINGVREQDPLGRHLDAHEFELVVRHEVTKVER
jgi:protein-disulfide isomerase